MMGSRGRGRDLQPVAEINVTSMVDVAFTLLIIFIITAPILQGGIEVAVPETDVSSLTADDNTLIISLDRDGIVYVGETPMDRTEFEASFAQIVSGGTVPMRPMSGATEPRTVNQISPSASSSRSVRGPLRAKGSP